MDAAYFEKVQAQAAKVASLQGEFRKRKDAVKAAQAALTEVAGDLMVAQDEFRSACDLMIPEAGGMSPSQFHREIA